ncbi:MAG: hypothetical protein EBR09_14390 [Proteobacteria bacterium]|nr:hypothetical protein [Pseudomonadota bacterium]
MNESDKPHKIRYPVRAIYIVFGSLFLLILPNSFSIISDAQRYRSMDGGVFAMAIEMFLGLFGIGVCLILLLILLSVFFLRKIFKKKQRTKWDNFFGILGAVFFVIVFVVCYNLWRAS